jgi:hypothetical protein
MMTTRWRHLARAAGAYALLLPLLTFALPAANADVTAKPKSGQMRMENKSLMGMSFRVNDKNTEALAPNSYPVSAEHAPEVAGPGQIFTLPLATLAGSTAPVKLTGVNGTYTFSIPVPALWRARRVTLTLAGTASRALIDTSQLVIMVNGTVVRQFALAAMGDSFTHQIEIPTTLLKSGYNDVRIEAAMHYTNTCEYSMAPQLWTQLSLEQSNISILADPVGVTPLLSKMDDFFDKTDWQTKHVVPVLTKQVPTAGEMQALALVAQGIGQRFDYVPVSIQHRLLPATAKNFASHIDPLSRGAVVIGTFANLKPYLVGIDGITGTEAVIAVRPFPDDPTRFMLILAAPNDEKLIEVAKAFSVKYMPWPDSASTVVKNLKLPEVEGFDVRSTIPYAPSGAFPLRALGFKTTTFKGVDSPGSSIRFWNGSWQGRAQLRVHLTYASGISAQSALNIMVNGVLHGSIPLNNPNGGTYEKYAVSIPAVALKQGWNQLELKPVMVPISNGGECRPIYNGNLALTIYEDTTMQKFGGNATNTPDLSLLSGAGRFYTYGPSGQDMSVQLTDSGSPTISAGMTFVGKLSQVYGGPLHRLQFGTTAPSGSKNQFWIGPYDQLPANVQSVFFRDLKTQLTIQAPLAKTSTFAVLEGAEWFSQWMDFFGINTVAPRYSIAQVDISNTLRTSVFAKTALEGDKEVTVITAEKADVLQQGVEQVVQHGGWSQLQGSLAIWRIGSDKIHTVALDDAAFSAYGLRGGISILISQHPWRSLTALLLLITLMVLLTRRALVAYRKEK